MKSIALDKYARLLAEINPGTEYEEFKEMLSAAVARKKDGALCINCGRQIWAIGSALCGWNGCFFCIALTADHEGDFEIDEVNWPLWF